jgi:hypothetical protein
MRFLELFLMNFLKLFARSVRVQGNEGINQFSTNELTSEQETKPVERLLVALLTPFSRYIPREDGAGFTFGYVGIFLAPSVERSGHVLGQQVEETQNYDHAQQDPTHGGDPSACPAGV